MSSLEHLSPRSKNRDIANTKARTHLFQQIQIQVLSPTESWWEGSPQLCYAGEPVMLSKLTAATGAVSCPVPQGRSYLLLPNHLKVRSHGQLVVPCELLVGQGPMSLQPQCTLQTQGSWHALSPSCSWFGECSSVARGSS